MSQDHSRLLQMAQSSVRDVSSTACVRTDGHSNIMHLVLWHVDPLLGSDREVHDYVTAVPKFWLCKQ
jgi:hypothetical protein